MMLRTLVLKNYQRVTDRQTDMPPMAKSRSSIDEHDKITDYTRVNGDVDI